jgi:hypothetical protein
VLSLLIILPQRMQKLLVPFEMRGYQGVYNLERKVYAVHQS